MKQLAAFLALWISLTSWAQPKLSYTVSPVSKTNFSVFQVELTIKGNASGKTTFSIPFEEGQYRPQDQITVLGAANSLQHQRLASDSTRYVITHKPNALLTVKYWVKNALKDSLPTIEEACTQMLTEKYYYIMGSYLWIVPADSAATAYPISIQWKGFPKQWSHLNTFGANQLNQHLTVTLNEFKEAIYMGGDIRVHQMQINNKALYLGIRGQWKFTDSELLQLINKTVTAQRSYWNDYLVPHYVVGLIPMKYSRDEEQSITGRGLTNTFITVGTNSKAFGLNNLFFLYNHELMHHWLGYVLRQGEPENAFKWFSEGFTDYFAYVIMLEKGLMDEQEYKKRINGIFGYYYSDSTHQWPNEKVQAEYWSTYEMQQLPYKRGLLFALYLDESIKKYTVGKASLKTVLQAMFAEARQQHRAYSNEWLLQLLQQTTGHDYQPELEEYMIKGRFIPIEQWQQVTDKVVLVPMEVFDLGFTTAGAMALNVAVASVQEGSNVQRAGLQVGDRIAGLDYNKFEPTHAAMLVVKRGEEKVKLQFLPNTSRLLPQLK